MRAQGPHQVLKVRAQGPHMRRYDPAGEVSIWREDALAADKRLADLTPGDGPTRGAPYVRKKERRRSKAGTQGSGYEISSWRRTVLIGEADKGR